MTAIEFVTPIKDEIRPESADAPDDAPESVAGDDTCIVCGKPLSYSGRGRRPKYCDEHRPSRGGATKAATAGRSTKHDRMKRELTGTLALIGTGLMMVEPYDGIVVLDRAEATVDALMDVAAHNPRVMKALEQMIDVTVWGALGTALAGIIVPITAHHGVLPIDVRQVERQFLSEDAIKRAEIMRGIAQRTPDGEQ